MPPEMPPELNGGPLKHIWLYLDRLDRRQDRTEGRIDNLYTLGVTATLAGLGIAVAVLVAVLVT